MLLLGITVADNLTFVEHFNNLLRHTRSNMDDLDRAGATTNGFDLRTSLSMWTTIFVPNYIYALNIWYNVHMQPQLDAVLISPVINMVAPMSSAYITPEHNDIITLELRLPLAKYQQWYSELSHESRLYHKPSFNPAGQLCRILITDDIDHRDILQARLDTLSLRWTDMLTDHWTLLLKRKLLAMTMLETRLRLQTRSQHSHVAAAYLNTTQTTLTDPPFHKIHKTARRVLTIRLQLAPLANIYFNGSMLGYQKNELK
jgi:hypothetical protein